MVFVTFFRLGGLARPKKHDVNNVTWGITWIGVNSWLMPIKYQLCEQTNSDRNSVFSNHTTETMPFVFQDLPKHVHVITISNTEPPNRLDWIFPKGKTWSIQNAKSTFTNSTWYSHSELMLVTNISTTNLASITSQSPWNGSHRKADKFGGDFWSILLL